MVESELAKFGKMLVNFVRGSRARGPSRARLSRADRAPVRGAQLIHFPWKYVVAFAVGLVVTVAVTLGVRTSSDARPYLYNGGKLGSLEKESVFVGDKKKN